MGFLKQAWQVIYILFVTIALFSLLSDWGYDDPYITYRYAQNIAHGAGFVYNLNERILSTTTPLFSLLLAGSSLIWDNIPKLANLMGAFGLALGAIFLWRLAQTWKTPTAGWVSLLLYPTFPLIFTTISSETPLYLAFCLGTFAYYADKRYNLAALFAALAILTRPDGILVPVILAAHYLILIRRPIPWKAIAIFLIPTILWFAFAWIYFGSPLPVTLAVKQNQGTLAISQRFAQGFVTTIKPYTNSWHYPYAAIIAVIGIVYSFVFRREWLLFLTWPVVYFLSFTILGVSRYFWYYAPLVPGFVIAIGLGIAFLIDKLSQLIAGTSSNKSVQKLQLVAITLLLITPLLVKQVNNLYKLSNKIDPRFEIYTAIGKWLAVNTPPDATVGVLEVGIIGYNAERTMIDFAGLLNPQITEQLRADTDYQDAAIWAFSTFNPDYVVLHTDIWPGFEQGYIAERCVNAQRFPGENFGYSQSVDIYQCSY